MTSVWLIVVTDRFGRRNIVLISSAACTVTMLVVGILGFVEKTTPLLNFLIFVACVWSFFSSARESCPQSLTSGMHTYSSHSRQSRLGFCRRGVVPEAPSQDSWVGSRDVSFVWLNL